jgi:hypothetical protein
MIGVARYLPGTSSPGPTTTARTMVPAHLYDPNYYWGGAEGRVGNYIGAYLLLGSRDYVWFTIDGNGTDPGLSVASLSGRSGRVVALTDAMSATAVAAATATVISAVQGWTASNVAGALTCRGPGSVTTPLGWDARGGGEMLGMRVSRAGGFGGTSATMASRFLGQHLTAPAYATRLTAVEIFINGTANVAASERTHFALYAGSSSVTPVTGSALIVDLGQIPTSIVANAWTRLWVPSTVAVALAASQSLWLAFWSDGVATTLGFYTVASTPPVTFTAQGSVLSTSVMPTAATTAAPSSWTGTVGAGPATFVMARLIVERAPYASDATLHSTLDPLIVGAHIAALTNASVLPAVDAVLTQTSQLPPSIGPVESVAVQMCVAFHGTDQPRLGQYVGANYSDPEIPDITGATLVQDGGRMTGAVADDWVSVPVTGSIAAGAVLTPVLVHAGPAGPGTATTIRYTDAAVWGDANPLDAPCDFVEPGAPGPGVGPEVATASTVGALSIDPAVALPAVLPALGGAELRPGNVGGTRSAVRCAGIT